MPRTSKYRLMCRDHVAILFEWDHETSRLTGKLSLADETYVPFGCFNHGGVPTRPNLSRWIADRSIPKLRPNADEVLSRFGFSSSEDLMIAACGRSLTDQYWIAPIDSSLSWSDVSCFENEFPSELGELLLPHSTSSDRFELHSEDLESYVSVATSSPDAALNGNLPKAWEIRNGTRLLVKSGRKESLHQEATNEEIASRLCERIMPKSSFVPYHTEERAVGGSPALTSVCPCMVDSLTEFVPAAQLLDAYKRRNDESYLGFFLRCCDEHGIDVRRELLDMLVVDYVLNNVDRHWNNFGVLIDSETREWKRLAPVFDTGEALWLGKTVDQIGRASTFKHPKPFARSLEAHLETPPLPIRHFDPSVLAGFEEVVESSLSSNRFISTLDPGRIDATCKAYTVRAKHVEDLITVRSNLRFVSKSTHRTRSDSQDLSR